MILGYHLTFGAYGFWLPNDPRGSWSTYVGSRKLYRLGPATKTISRESSAHLYHDRRARLAAKSDLKFPAVAFSGEQASAIGTGFRIAVEEAAYQVYACAIMPTHVHLIVARHARNIRKIARHLKAKASMQLCGELWPFADDRPAWERGAWVVYLDDRSNLFNAIRYVEENPVKDGFSPQRWSFVQAPTVPADET
jgi:REP element-mobilizing transposase RayT